MTSRTPSACTECGQQLVEVSCRDCFDSLLAYENERPAVFGAVHHLTVSTWYLQHPSGYTAEALASWRALLADSLDTPLPTSRLLARMRAQFEGARRVRLAPGDPASHLDAWPRAWPLTVASVLNPNEPLPDDAEYVNRARAWARGTLAALQSRGD